MSPSRDGWRSSYKILIVSPDPKLRRLMKITLDDFGSVPSEATDGITTLRQAFSIHPDIIVLQRELPDQDGLELLNRLKEELHLHRPPVIILTKGSDADSRLACFAADADDVMSIPFDARELKARVEAVLRRGGFSPVKNPFTEKHLTALAGNVFDTFVEGRSNRAAVEAARTVAEYPGTRFNPLFIYGPPGVGKTHLLSAIGHHLSNLFSNKVTMYVPVPDFSNEFLAAIATGEMELFHSKYTHADVLLIDDIQYLGAGGHSFFEETAKLFTVLAEQGRQVVTSGDRSLEDLKTDLRDVYPVLEKGLVAKIDLPDRNLRFRILQTQNLLHKWGIADGILSMIADVVASDARALQGAARKLVALRSIQGGVLTPERARDAIADLARGEEVIEEAAIKSKSISDPSHSWDSGSYELGSEETPKVSRTKPDYVPKRDTSTEYKKSDVKTRVDTTPSRSSPKFQAEDDRLPPDETRRERLIKRAMSDDENRRKETWWSRLTRR